MDPRAINLGDIETIQNLDTARMALRWALERLQAHDKTIRDLEKSLEDKEKTRKRETDSMEAHKSWVEDREKYFKSMEKLFAMLTNGEFDIPAFAEKEVGLERMRRNLDQARSRLEGELEARRGELEKNYQELHEASRVEVEAAKRSVEETKARENDIEERRRLMETDRERQEALLAAGLKNLEARERVFEEKMAEGERDALKTRGELEKEYQALREEMHQADLLRRREWEDERRKQQETLERAWPAEKLTLENELRGQTQRARLSEDLLARTKENLHNVEARLKEEGLQLQKERSQMMASLANWRKSMEETLALRIEGLDADQVHRTELFESREAGFRGRDKQWTDKHIDFINGLAEKSRQLEDLRKKLLETIRDYNERRQENRS